MGGPGGQWGDHEIICPPITLDLANLDTVSQSWIFRKFLEIRGSVVLEYRDVRKFWSHYVQPVGPFFLVSPSELRTKYCITHCIITNYTAENC